MGLKARNLADGWRILFWPPPCSIVFVPLPPISPPPPLATWFVREYLPSSTTTTLPAAASRPSNPTTHPRAPTSPTLASIRYAVVNAYMALPPGYAYFSKRVDRLRGGTLAKSGPFVREYYHDSQNIIRSSQSDKKQYCAALNQVQSV